MADQWTINRATELADEVRGRYEFGGRYDFTLDRQEAIAAIAGALEEATNRLEPRGCSHCGAFHQPDEMCVSE